MQFIVQVSVQTSLHSVVQSFMHEAVQELVQAFTHSSAQESLHPELQSFLHVAVHPVEQSFSQAFEQLPKHEPVQSPGQFSHPEVPNVSPTTATVGNTIRAVFFRKSRLSIGQISSSGLFFEFLYFPIYEDSPFCPYNNTTIK